MNEQYVKGATDKVTGKAKELPGTTGNRKLKIEGKIDQVKGAIHHAAGDAKDAGKRLINSEKTRPVSSEVR